MIRFLVTYDTPADPAAFDAHYQDVHAPLTRKLPGLLSYEVIRSPRAVRGAPFYQVAELTWADWDAVNDAFASPQGRATAADMTNLDAPVRSCLYEIRDAG